MTIPAALVFIPVGILFLVSGLIVNSIQLVFFIIVRPFSRSLYRRINKNVAELLWLQLIWLSDWWACIKVRHGPSFYSCSFEMEADGDVAVASGQFAAGTTCISSGAILLRLIQENPVQKKSWLMHERHNARNGAVLCYHYEHQDLMGMLYNI